MNTSGELGRPRYAFRRSISSSERRARLPENVGDFLADVCDVFNQARRMMIPSNILPRIALIWRKPRRNSYLLLSSCPSTDVSKSPPIKNNLKAKASADSGRSDDWRRDKKVASRTLAGNTVMLLRGSLCPAYIPFAAYYFERNAASILFISLESRRNKSAQKRSGALLKLQIVFLSSTVNKKRMVPK